MRSRAKPNERIFLNQWPPLWRRPRPRRSRPCDDQGHEDHRRGSSRRLFRQERRARKSPCHPRSLGGRYMPPIAVALSVDDGNPFLRPRLCRGTARLLHKGGVCHRDASYGGPRCSSCLRGRPAFLWVLHTSLCPVERSLRRRDRSRCHRHVGVLERGKGADGLGRRRLERSTGHAWASGIGPSSRCERCGGHHQDRRQSSENPRGDRRGRTPLDSNLCRTWHQRNRNDRSPCRQGRRSCALFFLHSHSRPRQAPMSAPGRLRIVGLGPGGDAWITPEASHLIANATDLVGYAPYLERLPPKQGQTRHQTGNRVEMERARHALRLVEDGRHVALVSGGDPGVFAMAAAVFEAIEEGDPGWGGIDVAGKPRISGVEAAAARTGAPLGHDFCAISLSDNRKPWSLVERRLAAAANAGFVVALYHPACALRRGLKAASTPVVFARAVGREDEHIFIATLGSADPGRADMSTLILVGSSETRIVPRRSGTPFVYTPRGKAAR